MNVPSKIHNSQLVQISPEARLAATLELNPSYSLVTGGGEVGRGCCGAATQVKGLNHEIFIVPEAAVVHLTEGRSLKPIDGKIVQTTLWESDQFIVPLKRGNVRRGKGLAVGLLGPGHIHSTTRQIKGGNKTGLITYPVNGRGVLLKSRRRENHKTDSVRGLIAASRRMWL